MPQKSKSLISYGIISRFSSSATSDLIHLVQSPGAREPTIRTPLAEPLTPARASDRRLDAGSLVPMPWGQSPGGMPRGFSSVLDRHG